MKTHIFSAKTTWVAVFFIMSAAAGFAAIPFDSAMVTRVENKVTLGEIKGRTVAGRRPAAVADVVKADNFVQTTSNSRAELQFRDKSLVRVGQNSVFSFQADTRTLSLESGEMLFYVVPGKGGATIKTPTLTAAVTGTTALVRENEIIVLEGKLTLKDKDGNTVTIEAGGEFNAARFEDGKLVGYKVDVTKLSLPLYSWAKLPDGVEKMIADANPGWERKLIAGEDQGDATGSGATGLGLAGLLNPIFGGGAGTGGGNATTNVNPPGPVPIIEEMGGPGNPPPDPDPPGEFFR
ncbi:MAG: FecR family protein [Chthoniobacteraceae bacterium]